MTAEAAERLADVAEIERSILALGYGTAEYHEALGFYFLTLARSQWRRADSIRTSEADSARRRAAAARRPQHSP